MSKIDYNKFDEFIKKKSDDSEYYEYIRLSDITKPVTVLLGPNGSGKSRTLRYLKERLDVKGLPYVEYSTTRDDIVNRNINFDPIKLMSAFKSEGERMTDSFIDWCKNKFFRGVMKNGPIYILIDEADSGLSIDRLAQTLQEVLRIVLSEYFGKGRIIRIIFTCNSYEMYEVLQTNVTDNIWIPTRQHVNFSNYEEFKKPYIYYYNNYYTD